MKPWGEEGFIIFDLGGYKGRRRSHAGALQKSTRFPRFPISQETLRKSNLTQKIPLQALFQVDKTTYVTSYECTWKKNENRTYLCTESHTFPTEVPFHTFCWVFGSKHIVALRRLCFETPRLMGLPELPTGNPMIGTTRNIHLQRSGPSLLEADMAQRERTESWVEDERPRKQRMGSHHQLSWWEATWKTMLTPPHMEELNGNWMGKV